MNEGPNTVPPVQMRLPSDLPPRVAAAVQVLEFLNEREAPSFTLASLDSGPSMVSSGPRQLSKRELAVREAALQYLILYFHREVDN